MVFGLVWDTCNLPTTQDIFKYTELSALVSVIFEKSNGVLKILQSILNLHCRGLIYSHILIHTLLKSQVKAIPKTGETFQKYGE
jgi:hypothetical protein